MAAVDVSRVETIPIVGDVTRVAIHTSRVAMVRLRRWAGPFKGVLANVEERLYAQEKRLISQLTPGSVRRYDLRQPFEMTPARRAAIERAASSQD